jgi:hypothetical protein
MTNKTTSHLLIHSTPSQARNDRYAGTMETERQPQPFKVTRPVAGGISVKRPSMTQSLLLQLEQQRFNLRHKLGGVEFPALQLEGDFVASKINTRKREASFSQPASLVDCNRPTDFFPVNRNSEGGFNDNPFLIGDFRLLSGSVRLHTHFSGGIGRDVPARDGFIEDLSQDTEIKEGGIEADLAGPRLLAVVLVIEALSPCQIFKAMGAGDSMSGTHSLHGEKLKKVAPSKGVAFKREILLLVGSVKPRLHPCGKLSVIAFLGRSASFNDLLGRANLSRLASLMDRINPFSGGFLLPLPNIVDKFNPPVRGAVASVEGSHSVGSVGQSLKKANNYRENQREIETSLQSSLYSWFKSMRGSFSVYGPLAGSVGNSVGEKPQGGLNG